MPSGKGHHIQYPMQSMQLLCSIYIKYLEQHTFQKEIKNMPSGKRTSHAASAQAK